METILTWIITAIINHIDPQYMPHAIASLGVLLALSELLSLMPRVKSNGNIQLIFNIIRKLSGSLKMKKTLLALFILLMWPLSAWAAPFLVCNPVTGADYYVVTGLPGAIPASNITPDPTGTYGAKLDLAALVPGSYTVTAQACSIYWGCSSATGPFSFARPALLSTPSGVGLVK